MAIEPYDTIRIYSPDFPARRIEQLGSKPKFWFTIKEAKGGEPALPPGKLGLFKQTRAQTGEAWAEKVACTLADLIGLPHAEYQLAAYDDENPEGTGTRGVIGWSFLESNESLVHGNEVLSAVVSGYPKASDTHYRRTPAHTVECVLTQCAASVQPPLRWQPPAGIRDAADVMVGYLMFDAWIGNTDRHDENWGWVLSAEGLLHLAPTYDHSSSLGRNEPDTRRMGRLLTRNPGYSVEAYALRAPSGLHRDGDGAQLRTLEAFLRAAAIRPGAAAIWLDRLQGLTLPQWGSAVERVPADWISLVARQFAIGILTATRRALLAASGRPVE